MQYPLISEYVAASLRFATPRNLLEICYAKELSLEHSYIY